MILENDIQLRASQRMTDKNDGGGQMSLVTLENNKVNQLFGPVSSAARIAGQVNLRQVHLYLSSTNDDVYYGVGAILDSKPADANTGVMLFKIGDTSTTRPSAQRYMESYVSMGGISQMHPVGTQIAGARQITAYMDSTDDPPKVGDIYILSVESGAYIGTTTSFQVQTVETYTDTFYYYPNESVTSELTSFECKVVVMGISVALGTNFPGADPKPTRPGESVIRRTTAAASAEYHGISTLTSQLTTNGLVAHVASVMMPVVSVTQEEEVSAEIALASITFPFTIGGYTVNVTDVVYTTAINITPGNNGVTWSIPLTPIPSTNTLVVSYLSMGVWYELTDNAGVLSGSDVKHGMGSINYVTGACVLSLGHDPDVGSAIIFQWGSASTYTAISDATFGKAAITLDFDLTGANTLQVSYDYDGTTYSFTVNSPTASVNLPTANVHSATINWTNGDIVLEFLAMTDADTQIQCIAKNITASTTWTEIPFTSESWVGTATLTIPGASLLAGDKWLEWTVSVSKDGTLLPVGNSLRPIGEKIIAKWDDVSGQLTVTNWTRAITASPIGTVNTTSGATTIDLDFNVTEGAVTYRVWLETGTAAPIDYTIAYTDQGTDYYMGIKIEYQVGGVWHYAFLFYEDGAGLLGEVRFIGDGISSITFDGVSTLSITWAVKPDGTTFKYEVVVYDNLWHSLYGPAITDYITPVSPDRPIMATGTILQTHLYDWAIEATYYIDVYKNSVKLADDDGVTPLWGVATIKLSNKGEWSVKHWHRNPTTVSLPILGTTNTLTGDTSIQMDFSTTVGSDTYEILATGAADVGARDFGITYVNASNTLDHNVTAIGSPIVLKTGNGASSVIKTQSFPTDTLEIPIVTTNTGNMLPGSFRFKWHGYEYHDDTVGNNMYRCQIPWVEGNKVAAGSINKFTKKFNISLQEKELISTATDIVFAVSSGERYLSEIWAKTPMANIRPGTLTLTATAADGHVIHATANQNGVIADDDTTAAEVSGTVDQQHGYIHVIFTVPVQPGTVSYSCVFINTLPITAEELGVDPARFPSSGNVPIFSVGNAVVIHRTGTVSVPAPTAGAIIQTGTGEKPLARVRFIDARSRVVMLADGIVDYGKRVLLANAPNPASYEFWEIDTNGMVWVPSQTNLEDGKVQLADPIDLTGYDLPFTMEYTIEHAAMATSVNLDGSIEIDRKSPIAFPVGSLVSSQLSLGDIFARYTNVFHQNTWTKVWSDSLIGDACDALYNDVLFPIEVTNRGAIAERWRIVFTGATMFDCIGEVTGWVGSGNTGADFSPANPLTGFAYFFIDKRGWSSVHSVGNVLRFNTIRGAVFWVARCIQPGSSIQQTDKFGITFRGEVASE